MVNRILTPAASLAALAFALAIPFLGNLYWLGLGVDVLIFAILAIGMNIVVGYAGLLDLGYAAFFAIGSYVTALLMADTHWSFWVAWPFSGIAAGLFGMVVGAPTLRLRTDYLAIVTLGFGEITRLVITNLDVTGGPTGLYDLREPQAFGMSIESQTAYYWLALAMLLAGLGCTVFLRRSRLGAAWSYIRNDEDLAQAVGINPIAVKLAAYGLGAIWGGLAGALYVESAGAVSPTSFTFTQSLLVVIAVLLGGQGSLPGVLIGTVLAVGLPEFFRTADSWRFLAFGIVLIVVMLCRPRGLIRDAHRTALEKALVRDARIG
jgi:branched-chain amino acid transport system permease protein